MARTPTPLPAEGLLHHGHYLVCSSLIRNAAIKSKVGLSGKQRVQTDVVQDLEIDLSSIHDQKKIGALLRSLDDKIELNNKVSGNLWQRLFVLHKKIVVSSYV